LGLDGRPYVLKNPRFCTQIKNAASRLHLDMVYIPTRKTELAAASRAHMNQQPGGLWNAKNAEDQVPILETLTATLLRDLQTNEVPYVELDFPRLIDDAVYCYEKLGFLMDKYDITLGEFTKAHSAIADPSKVRFRAAESSSPNAQCQDVVSSPQ
jgi:hypothetical protein